MKKKETRGGARPGAGRPNENKVKITVTVDKVLADWAKSFGNGSGIVNAALYEYYRKFNPKSPAGN